MLDQDVIDGRLTLLAAHRRRLAHRLRQHARLGEYAPPEVTLDIEDAQTAIREIKTQLRAGGVPVANHPDDEAQASAPSTRLTPLERRNRSRMIQKVRDFWIKGVLETSLHGGALLTLGLEQRPTALVDPWDRLVQQPDRPNHQLLAGTRIVGVFDDCGGELLILGSPGSGKTTLLLELTRELIARAETDETAPLPVVLNLSSWATRHHQLIDWLVDELNTRYDVPRVVAQSWVAADAVMPLLDGLDEVAQDQRVACVAAINTFRHDHGLVALVLCSRVADYEALATRLRLQGAVLVQPPSQQQIDDYLASAGDRLAALRVALTADPMLRELAETPLLLSVMTLAYQGVAVDALPTHGTIAERRHQLFATYVERMFTRRGADPRYPRQRTIHWLAWLARGMTQQAQSIFLTEQLQPDLLTTAITRWQYGILDRLGSALVCGGGVGLGAWLISGLVGSWNPDPALIYGVIAGVTAGIFGETSATQTRPSHSARQSARDAILGALGVGLTAGLIGGLIGGIPPLVVIGLLGGLVGMLAGTLAGAPSIRPRRIVVVEALRWSWSRARRAAANGLGIGLAFGLIFGLIASPEQAPILRNALVGGLAGGLGSGLAFALVGGLGSDEIATRVAPNEGIRRSIRSALLGGLAVGLGFGTLMGLLFGLPYTLVFGLRSGLVNGGGMGLTFALVGGLAYGGYASLAHLALRLILWRSGALPWNYTRFLDYCAERIFLRKVGGGYLFAHRLLLEYFASLDA